MNVCKRFSESFSDYAENAMPAEQQRALEAHLSACPGCQTAVTRLQDLRSTLNNLSKLQAQPDFETLLRARIRREGRRLPVSSWHRPAMPRLALYGLAATLIFLSASLWLRQNSGFTPKATILSIDQPLQSPLYRTAAPIIPLTAQIFYTLDKFSPRQFPASRMEERSSFADSLSLNLKDLPRGPQNSRASLYSL